MGKLLMLTDGIIEILQYEVWGKNIRYDNEKFIK